MPTMDDLKHIKEPAVVAVLLEQAQALDFTMASEPKTGALLRVLASAKPGGKLLELGTGVGVGTAWMLAGMDVTATLVSVDTNLKFQSVALRNLGSDSRLSLVLEDALDFVSRQPEESFDLVFADAMRGKYEGLDESLRLVKRGGFFVIDDLIPQPTWPEGHEAKVGPLMEELAEHEEFNLAPMAWASGIVVAVKKS
jgi:predicted O-methyltransferase YrrM